MLARRLPSATEKMEASSVVQRERPRENWVPSEKDGIGLGAVEGLGEGQGGEKMSKMVAEELVFMRFECH